MCTTKIFRKLLQLQHTPTPQLQCNALLHCSPVRDRGFPSFQSGPTLGGQWGLQVTGGMAGTSLPLPSARGLPRVPYPPSWAHHPCCRTLGSARCQKGAKHPPLPPSSSETSSALWKAGRSGNKFMAKASQEASSSCESVTQSQGDTQRPHWAPNCRSIAFLAFPLQPSLLVEMSSIPVARHPQEQPLQPSVPHGTGRVLLSCSCSEHRTTTQIWGLAEASRDGKQERPQAG